MIMKSLFEVFFTAIAWTLKFFLTFVLIAFASTDV